MQHTCDKHRHFVLVHGLGHGAWCWFKLKPLLESAGHRVSTFNLSASGTDTKVIQQVPSFYDYSTPLLDFMASIPPEEKVILVGHIVSVLSQLYIETRFLVDYIMKLVERIPQDRWLDTQFLPYKDEETEVSMLFGPKFVSSKLYQLCSDEVFLKHLASTIQINEDETIKEDFQRWMIDNSPVDEVIELKGVDHMPMLCDPKQLTVCLLDIALRYDICMIQQIRCQSHMS
ncbi:hypothetical protein CTI12_AA318990 [Artemisia annua]|uniref:AB hydrolase-1 domain-containing protein n=1 Tax=Artemisia annua TaxID=35608 RepID=A0A2U1N139_ARTAN|nr:hypothetical protein CTI12_AA318990 [Artemisia annua]